MSDLPNIGEFVSFCGTVCVVKGVNKDTRILTVKVMKGDYISYVYADDVDALMLNSKEIDYEDC